MSAPSCQVQNGTLHQRSGENVIAQSPSKTPGTFDPEALLAAQRRNVEAFTSAGKIVADGMRSYAQSQVGMMQGAMRNLWGAIQTGGRAPPRLWTRRLSSPGCALPSTGSWLRSRR